MSPEKQFCKIQPVFLCKGSFQHLCFPTSITYHRFKQLQAVHLLQAAPYSTAQMLLPARPQACRAVRDVCEPLEKKSHRWQQGLVLQGAGPDRCVCTASFPLPFYQLSEHFLFHLKQSCMERSTVRSLSLSVSIPPGYRDGGVPPQGGAEPPATPHSAAAHCSTTQRLWAHPALQTAIRFYAAHL